MSEILSNLPDVSPNAILVRVNNAILNKNATSKKSHIEFLLNDNRVRFFKQPLSKRYKTQYEGLGENDKGEEKFDSNDLGSSENPRWIKDMEGEYTDGDVWIVLKEAPSSDDTLTIEITNGKFCGFVTVKISDLVAGNVDDNVNESQYDLFDKHGNGGKLSGCSVTFGAKYGAQIEIDIRSGDYRFIAGSGREPSNLEGIITHTDVFIGDLYKLFKKLNPLHIGERDTDDHHVNVLVQLNGTNNSSQFYICNQNTVSVDVVDEGHKGKSTKMKVFVMKSIGKLISLSTCLSNNSYHRLTWFLEKILLRFGEHEIKMPCYQWITAGKLKTLSYPAGILPQIVYDYPQLHALYLERTNEIEIAKSTYQWAKADGVPSFLRGTAFGAYDLVPLNEQFDDIKNKNFSYLIAKGTQNVVINAILDKVSGGILGQLFNLKFDKLEDFNNLYKLDITKALDKPFTSIAWKSKEFKELCGHSVTSTAKTHTYEVWNDDEFFAWTFIAGTNAMHIKICDNVKVKMPVEFLVPSIIENFEYGYEKECAEGRLFLLDYTGLAKYELHTKGVRAMPVLQTGMKYACPCRCLLYVKAGEEKLKPIGIQLMPGGLIFTPKDTYWQWTYAKMAVHNADAQYHQVYNHWLQTHAITESFSIAFNRNLSRLHPVFRLMAPHFKYSISINVLARKGLISPGGFVEQLLSIGEKLGQFLKDVYTEWDFNKTGLPTRLEAQGFGRDTNCRIKDFPYRDDGLLIWDAMFKYVGDYLALYYVKGDEDVKNDNELQAFLTEIKEVGHSTRTFNEIKTLPDLQQFLTTLMWTVSCQHSAVNFNQYSMYGYVPNYPTSLYRKPPTTKEEIFDEQFIMDSLPGKTHSCVQMLLLNVLSSFEEDNEEYLTSKRFMELIGDVKAFKCLTTYQDELKNIDKLIDGRNVERVKSGLPPFTLLKPSNVPNSIAI